MRQVGTRDERGAGNPLKSMVVKNLKKGQANDAKEKGYRQKSGGDHGMWPRCIW